MNPQENFIKLNSIVKSMSATTKIIVVTKKFDMHVIQPILDLGHSDFGENRVIEARDKWHNFLNRSDIKIHLIGKLQSNKAKEAISTFDYIHSLDSTKLAKELSKYEVILNKKIKYFIQINIGNEIQKNGIDASYISEFLKICKVNFKLNIIGLMCLPPANADPNPYFNKLAELAKVNGLKELSMGMSNDYECAIKNGATFIRVGSKIFSEV
jgi:pyridoxal phosphate enzyme (YggS family)